MRQQADLIQLELLRLALVLLACAGVGLALGLLWPLLCAGLLGMLLWHLHQALRICRYVQPNQRDPARFPDGIWGECAARTLELKARNLKRKNKISRFFKQFREAAEAIPEGLVVLNRKHEIDWCNRNARDLLELRWPRDRGRLLAQAYPDEVVCAMVSGDTFDQPLDRPARSNNARILAFSLTEFGKKRSQRMLVVRDVTRVRNLDATRRDFVANISHELRTPLTVVLGYLETLREDSEDCPQWQRPLELMAQQTQRMQSVVSDLLVLSRMELDTTTPPDEHVNMARLIHELADSARSLAEPSAHHIELMIEPGIDLRGATEDLRSALGNLLFNAVIHTRAGTRIQVRWRKRHGALVFEVHDSGDGIPAEHLPRLTERFYRVDPARSRETGGTGLGLAIVRQVLQRYGGRLHITSTLGQGSTFSALFPRSLRWGAK